MNSEQGYFLKTRIRNVIKDHARLSVSVDQLEDSSDLYSAGLTSHASVLLMLALENEFDLELPDSMLGRSMFQSIDSIAIAIGSLQQVAQ